LNNAAKYTEPGGHIWLNAELEGEQVVIRVKDTGIGIPPDMLPRIFDMFTQVDRSIERSQGGLGIGLTLAQRLVSMHGGEIEARSQGPGEGSVFIVRLSVAGVSQHVAQQDSDDGRPMPTAARRRILVVDDNQDSADSLAMFLNILGHEVHTAHDGLTAVEEAEAFEPSVILLDIGLPKLNGYEVARRIRETRGGEVVLIALTGWGQEEDRRRSREAGFDHHLTKPVDFNELDELLAGVNLRKSHRR
jgi:CheY-like chemotaxis protein/anti-sigma regulatory factor (Ser/Thr protein kinase)